MEIQTLPAERQTGRDRHRHHSELHLERLSSRIANPSGPSVGRFFFFQSHVWLGASVLAPFEKWDKTDLRTTQLPICPHNENRVVWGTRPLFFARWPIQARFWLEWGS